jgi:hypothetical protein
MYYHAWQQWTSCAFTLPQCGSLGDEPLRWGWSVPGLFYILILDSLLEVLINQR